MPQIVFSAPHLYDPDAPPLDDPNGMMHDTVGMLPSLGREKRFAFWVTDQLRATGRTVLGPHADESGWAVQINADGGFVVLFLGYEEKRAAFSVLIHGFDAQAAAVSAFEALKGVVETTEGTVIVSVDPNA